MIETSAPIQRTFSIGDLFEHDLKLFEGINAILSVNDFAFIRAKRDDLACKLAYATKTRLIESGAEVLHVSNGDDKLGFDLYSSIVDLSQFFLPSKSTILIDDEDSIITHWGYYGLSPYHFRMYSAYENLLREILKVSHASPQTFLILDGLNFEDTITKNILINLVRDLLTNSHSSLKLIIFLGDETDVVSLTASDVSVYLATKKIHFIDYTLPLPSFDALRSNLESNFFRNETADSLINSISRKTSAANLNSFDESFISILAEHFPGLSNTTTRGPRLENALDGLNAISKLQPDMFFNLAARRLASDEKLSVFEITKLIDFCYFYEYRHLLPLLRKLTKHTSPLVRLALLKPLQVFGNDDITHSQHVGDTIEALFPWLVTQTNPLFCEDTFFTLLRAYKWTVDPRVLAFVDTYLNYLEEIQHINADKLRAFREFHTTSSDATKEALIRFLREERSSGYAFVVKRNTRFISLVSTAVESIFFDHELVEYTEELAFLEEKINSLSSPISNELIAKANLAEEYTHAGKFEKARAIYLEIGTVSTSMQISDPKLFAEGSIHGLQISSGIPIENLDTTRLADYGLQIKSCHTQALFYLNNFLSGEDFSLATIQSLLNSFKATYDKDTRAVDWMLCPIIMWHATSNKLSIADRATLFNSLKSIFLLNDTEIALCELSFATNAAEALALVDKTLISGLFKLEFKPLRRIFAVSMLCDFADRFNLSHNRLQLTAARELAHTPFVSWRQAQESRDVVTSPLTNRIFTYLSKIRHESSDLLNEILSAFKRVERDISNPITHGMFVSTCIMSITGAKSVYIRLFYKVNNSIRQSLEFTIKRESNKTTLSYFIQKEDGATNLLADQGFEYSLRGSTARISDKQKLVEILIDSRNIDTQHNLDTICHHLVEKSSYLDLIKKTHEKFSAEYGSEQKVQALNTQQNIAFTRQIEVMGSYSKRLHTILNSLSVGVCSIVSEDLILGDETNAFFAERFMKNGSKRDFKSCVLDQSTIVSAQKELIVNAIQISFDQHHSFFGMNRHHLPTEITCPDEVFKTYEIAWNYNTDSHGYIKEFIIVFTDVTEIRSNKKLGSHNARRSEILTILSTLSWSDTDRFITTARQHILLIRQLLEDERIKSRHLLIRRELHTLKGLTRSFEFSQLMNLTHEAEELFLKENFVLSDLHDVLGEIEISISEAVQTYEQLFSKFKKPHELQADVIKSMMQFVEKQGLQDNPHYKHILADIPQENARSFILSLVDRTLSSQNLGVYGQPSFQLVCSDLLYVNSKCKETLLKVMPHLIVNSLVHGLEKKRLAGHENIQRGIRINISDSTNFITLEYSDDGLGLDIKLLQQSAKKKNLSYQSHAELCNLIFEPGLSTTLQPDTNSGRGIGLDAARAELDLIGGSLDLILVDEDPTSDFQLFKLRITMPHRSNLLLLPMAR